MDIVLLSLPLAALVFVILLAWSLVVAVRPVRLVAEGRWDEATRAAEHLERSWMGLLPGVRAGALYSRAVCLHLTGKLDEALAVLETLRNARALTYAASILEGGSLVITSYVGRWGLELEVADSGPGLSEESLARAFEPFYTTKPEAAGLGLSVVQRIAQAHGGDVVAVNCPEGGAAFTLRIPQRALEAAA